MATFRLLCLLSCLVYVTTVLSARLDAAAFSKTRFDFIVVGGGTAGVAVAVRLSEVSKFTVGIIEAGGYDPKDERILIPQGANTADLIHNAQYDWNFTTIPQGKLNGRSEFIARGKVLGGSSAVNLMGMILAGNIEYDEIGRLGNPGWSAKNTRKYFKKATHISVAPKDLQEATHATFLPQFHGTSGPIKQSFSSWYSQIIPTFFSTMKSVGFVIPEDGNDGRADAGIVTNPTLNIDQDTKTRSYSANAYYLPNQHRPNLHLLTGAQVIKVNISSVPDRSGKYTATGVTYVAEGRSYTASVKKEVIVSAGSIQSPHVLELSGIGRRSVLDRVGIKTIIDLPVGENYQDHLITMQAYELQRSIDTWDVFFNPEANATVFAEYKNNRTGPYTSSLNAGALATATMIVEDKALLSQWLQALDKAFNATKPSLGRRAVYEIERKRLLWNDKSAAIEYYVAPINAFPELEKPNTSYAHIASIQSHPFSRGTIHIQSADPLVAPRIDLNAFDFEIDKQLVTRGAKFAREKIAQSPLFSPSIVSYVKPLNITTDDEWWTHIANTITTPYHPCCTNAMLPRALDGVVDPTLKVYGTSNIRVVDVSILPFILATHLAGTAYAIAEQAADIIKEAYHV